MGLTMGEERWVAKPNGLILPQFPGLTFSYAAEIKYCQYKWTDEQYAKLASMLPGGFTLVMTNGKALADWYQDLKWIISRYKTHEKIIPVLESQIKKSTSYGEPKSVFVLMYQMSPEYLPLHINTGIKECEIIVQWRFQHT